MTPYCDFGFLAVLLVRAPGTAEAWKIARQLEAAFPIDYRHIHQACKSFILNQEIQTANYANNGIGKGLEATRAFTCRRD